MARRWGDDRRKARTRRAAWSRMDDGDQLTHLWQEHAMDKATTHGADRDWLHLEAHQTTAANHWHEDVDPDA